MKYYLVNIYINIMKLKIKLFFDILNSFSNLLINCMIIYILHYCIFNYQTIAKNIFGVLEEVHNTRIKREVKLINQKKNGNRK